MLDLKLIQQWQLHQSQQENELKETIDSINKSYKICEQILKNAYNKNGIKAGETHFSDVWIRDSAFACWGAIKLGDYEIVQNFLMNTLKNMNKKGQCPLRIGEKYFLIKFLGFKGPQGSTYIEDKYVSIPMDSNSLVIILFNKLVKESGDLEIAKRFYQKIKKAINWYENHLVNDLIHEGSYAGWADSIKKKGNVLYTNVLYYKAILGVANISKLLGNKDDELHYSNYAKHIQKVIVERFWNGSYLIDWVIKKKKKETFSVEANMMALEFDILDEEKASKVINYVTENLLNSSNGVPVVHKKYKFNDIYPPFLFIGLKTYHNGLYWLWISCIAAVALAKYGKKKEAIELMAKLSKKINEDGTVYEVYTKKGKPLNIPIYKSEKGFAWSSGLFIWAYNKLFTKHT